jgi:hypothetical protein
LTLVYLSIAMNFPKFLQGSALATFFLPLWQLASGQEIIKGTVFDHTNRYPLRGVSVLSTSGAGTETDSLGHYQIRVYSKDSIYLSWLGKIGPKYIARDIDPQVPFDMSLGITIDTLNSVSVRSKNRSGDSLQARSEYKKAFDYQGNVIEGVKAKNNGMGIGLDMDKLVDGKANTRAVTLQERLQKDEQDRYIESRFNKALVHKITGLDPPKLDSFMRFYRPTFEYLHTFQTDYEFYKYISDAAKSFSSIK